MNALNSIFDFVSAYPAVTVGIVGILITIILKVFDTFQNKVSRDLQDSLDLMIKVGSSDSPSQNAELTAIIELHKAKFYIKQNQRMMRRVNLLESYHSEKLKEHNIYSHGWRRLLRADVIACLAVFQLFLVILTVDSLGSWSNITTLGLIIAFVNVFSREAFLRLRFGSKKLKPYTANLNGQTLKIAALQIYELIGVPSENGTIRIYKRVYNILEDEAFDSEIRENIKVAYELVASRPITLLETEWAFKLNKVSQPWRVWNRTSLYIPFVLKDNNFTNSNYGYYLLIDRANLDSHVKAHSAKMRSALEAIDREVAETLYKLDEAKETFEEEQTIIRDLDQDIQEIEQVLQGIEQDIQKNGQDIQTDFPEAAAAKEELIANKKALEIKRAEYVENGKRIMNLEQTLYSTLRKLAEYRVKYKR